jgi:lipid-A-disaccharide synthase-like uncharacterized protein
MKWIVPLLVLAFIGAGVWSIAGPYRTSLAKPTPGSETLELLAGESRGVIECPPRTPGEPPVFRVRTRDGFASPDLTGDEVKRVFGQSVYDAATVRRPDWVRAMFRALHITSWGSLAWVALGLSGQLIFSARFIVQWLASEKEKRSIVPPVFWWISLAGGLMMAVYFIWRQELIGFLGQISGVWVYSRNIALLRQQK